MGKAEMDAGTFRLLIEATVGDGDEGDIALDDPAIFARSCRGVTDELNTYAFSTWLPLVFEYRDRTGFEFRDLERWPGLEDMSIRDWVCYALDTNRHQLMDMIKMSKLLDKKREMNCTCKSGKEILGEMMMHKMESPYKCPMMSCGDGDNMNTMGNNMGRMENNSMNNSMAMMDNSMGMMGNNMNMMGNSMDMMGSNMGMMSSSMMMMAMHPMHMKLYHMALHHHKEKAMHQQHMAEEHMMVKHHLHKKVEMLQMKMCPYHAWKMTPECMNKNLTGGRYNPN